MVALIKKLQERGYTYTVDGSIYYRIGPFPRLAKLAHLDADTLQRGASGRIDNDEYAKDDVRDFALWKAWTRRGRRCLGYQAQGKGRPGWHIGVTGHVDEIFRRTLMCVQVVGILSFRTMKMKLRNQVTQGTLRQLLATLPPSAGRQSRKCRNPSKFLHPARSPGERL